MGVTPVVFEGGPWHGRLSDLTRLPEVVTTPYAPPVPVWRPPARPSWRRHPWRWYRWQPPAPPPPPEMQVLRYRDSGETRDGRRVYRIGPEWPWFKGREASPDGDLYRALATACYAVHPMVRQDPQTRWVMDLGWYKRIRAIAVRPGTDPDEDDPEKWKPDPEDRLLGMRIDVQADGGAPHLENRRYPQDYP